MQAFLAKHLSGALVLLFTVLLIGGAGFFLGLKFKQAQVDKLQAKLDEYQDLGRRMHDIKTVIENDMKAKNQILVDAYKKEIDALRSDFSKANASLAAVTAELKKGGKNTSVTATALAEAIEKLPQGPARDAKIAEFVGLMSDPRQRQQLCAVTPLAEGQADALKRSFAVGAP